MPAKVESKPVSWLKPDPKQPRKQFDEGNLRRLGESLKVKQLQPVLAQPDGTLIAGERRYRAAMLVGLLTLEVKIADEQLSDSQIRVWQLTENMQREDLTGHEKWLACAELMCMNPAWQMKDLAESLHLDPSSCTRILSPSRCVPAVQEALAAGKLGLSDCYAISKAKSPAEQADLLALKLSGASRDTLEAQGRRRRNGSTSAVKVSRLKVPLPSGATVSISADEISLDDAIVAAQEAVKAMRAARDDGLDSRTAQAVWRDKAKAAS